MSGDLKQSVGTKTRFDSVLPESVELRKPAGSGTECLLAGTESSASEILPAEHMRESAVYSRLRRRDFLRLIKGCVR